MFIYFQLTDFLGAINTLDNKGFAPLHYALKPSQWGICILHQQRNDHDSTTVPFALSAARLSRICSDNSESSDFSARF